MKKLIFSAIFAAAAINAANADFQPAANTPGADGGFVGGAPVISTVKQAKEMRDDTNIILQGRIVQRVDNDDKYMFEDSTGTITVEIDKKDWRGQTVTPSDTVKLYGEVDRGLFSTEIDVDYVEKM